MIDLSLDARLLGLKLGLGDLNRPEPCHGYQHGCDCSVCLEREKHPEPAAAPASQPWELAA